MEAIHSSASLEPSTLRDGAGRSQIGIPGQPGLHIPKTRELRVERIYTGRDRGREKERESGRGRERGESTFCLSVNMTI